MFKEGDLIREVTKDGDAEVVRVLETDTGALNTHVAIGNDDGNEWVDGSDYELVTEDQKVLEPEANPHPMEEQTVAIVSFEGAVKREVKAIREAIKACETVSEFRLTVTASGPINDGEVEITYEIAKNSYSGAVKGNNVRECLSEFMRRHGWDSVNKPVAISYNGLST